MNSHGTYNLLATAFWIFIDATDIYGLLASLLLPGNKLAEWHGSLLAMQILIKNVPLVDDAPFRMLHQGFLHGYNLQYGDLMFGGANCLCCLHLLTPALPWLSRIDSYIRIRLVL